MAYYFSVNKKTDIFCLCFTNKRAFFEQNNFKKSWRQLFIFSDKRVSQDPSRRDREHDRFGNVALRHGPALHHVPARVRLVQKIHLRPSELLAEISKLAKKRSLRIVSRIFAVLFFFLFSSWKFCFECCWVLLFS